MASEGWKPISQQVNGWRCRCLVQQLDDDDRDFLRSTIERHHELTESAVAKGMLTSWSVEVSRFRTVMPMDYKRVLTVMKEAEQAGLSDDETVARVMEAAKA